MKRLDLTQMKSNQSGVVAEIQGGFGAMKRIHNLGIRRGKKITRVSSQLFHGPVTVKAGNLQVALGFGMAKKIIVEID